MTQTKPHVLIAVFIVLVGTSIGYAIGERQHDSVPMTIYLGSNQAAHIFLGLSDGTNCVEFPREGDFHCERTEGDPAAWWNRPDECGERGSAIECLNNLINGLPTSAHDKCELRHFELENQRDAEGRKYRYPPDWFGKCP